MYIIFNTLENHNNNYRSLSRVANLVTATTKEIKTSKKFIIEDIRIPVLKGIVNVEIQKQINKSIEGDIMEFKRQLEEAAEEYGTKAEKEGKEFKPYSVSTNYNITYNKNNTLSISILYYEFIGGRHTYIRSTYNFDLNTGKSIGLEDLFKSGINYIDIINKQIKNQLSTNTNLYPPGTAENFKGISRDQPFYLEDKDLVLFFGFNQIAPSVSEIPIIRIPYSSLKNQLKPIFLT